MVQVFLSFLLNPVGCYNSGLGDAKVQDKTSSTPCSLVYILSWGVQTIAKNNSLSPNPPKVIILNEKHFDTVEVKEKPLIYVKQGKIVITSHDLFAPGVYLITNGNLSTTKRSMCIVYKLEMLRMVNFC